MRKFKPTNKQVKEFLIDNFFWLVGTTLYSSAIIIFALPNNIAQSGLAGAAIIVNYLLHTPIGLTNLVLNIPLIILAWIFIGWKFVSKTLWVTVMLSVNLDLLNNILPQYTGDHLLAALFCGGLSGLGLSMVFVRGATSGGTDIIGKLVQLVFPHISIGRVLFVADAVVVISAAFVFKNVESALYAAIVIFVSTRVIDDVTYGVGRGKMLMVFTNFAEEISSAITSSSPRGVSILPAKGGYTGEERNMLVCCVRRSEVAKIMKIVKTVDPNNFTIIAEASEVLGKGFKESQ